MASEKTLKEKIEVMIHFWEENKIPINGRLWGWNKDKPPVFNWGKLNYWNPSGIYNRADFKKII